MPFAPKVQRYLRRGSYGWNKLGAWRPSLDRRAGASWLPGCHHHRRRTFFFF